MGEMADYYAMADEEAEAADAVRRQWITGKDVDNKRLRLIAEQARHGLWTQRDGSKIAITDMSDGHLQNARAMLARKGFVGEEAARDIRECLGPGPSGEMATEAFEAWAFAGLDKYATSEVLAVVQGRVSPWLDILDAEIMRRTKKGRAIAALRAAGSLP